MKKFRIIPFVLAAALMLSVFSGCTGSKPTSSSQVQSTGASSTQSSAAQGEGITFPLEEKVTLTYWIPLSVNAASVMDDYNGSVVYQKLEELTNVHIEFIHPANGSEGEQFNLMLASSKYPDLISNANANYKGGSSKGVSDGVYLQLNDLIDQYAPNYKALRESNPEIARETIGADGVISVVWPIAKMENPCWQGPVLRKDWLDETGLPVPETIDEWEAVLRAMKENHPDGTPLMVALSGKDVCNFKSSGTDAHGCFVGAYNVGPYFYVDNGTVKYGPMEQGFKEYLTTMNRWYEEGLIDKDFPTRDNAATDSMFAAGEAGAIVRSIDTADALLKSQGVEWVAAPYPTLNKGETAQYRAKDWSTTSGEVAISTQCENPEIAVAWLDFAYSKVGEMLFNFGIEGETYTMENGEPVFTDVMLNNPDMAPEAALFKYKMDKGAFLRWGAYSNPTSLQNTEVMDAKISWTENTGDALILPPISLSTEESTEAAKILSAADVYRQEMVLKFIMGIEPLDKFDDYVEQLKSMDIESAIALYQAAYDRFMAM